MIKCITSCFFVCGLFGLVPSWVQAVPSEAMLHQVEPPAPDQHYQTTDQFRPVSYKSVEFLDWTQRVASDYVETLNDGIDSFFMGAFFNDETLEDNSSGSNGRVYVLTVLDDELQPSYQAGLNLRLVLPNTRDRFKLLIETDENEDDSVSNALETADNVTYTTAIRVDLQQERNWKASLDNGVRWAGEPVFFSRVRVRRVDYFQTWRTRVLQTISWRTDEKWGARFNTNATRPLGFTQYFRMGFEADYLLDNDFVEFETNVAIFDELSARSAMLYQLAFFADTEDVTRLTDTVLSISYRRKIYKQHMFAQWVPELSWPEDNGYKLTPAITFQLEMIFGADN